MALQAGPLAPAGSLRSSHASTLAARPCCPLLPRRTTEGRLLFPTVGGQPLQPSSKTPVLDQRRNHVNAVGAHHHLAPGRGRGGERRHVAPPPHSQASFPAGASSDDDTPIELPRPDVRKHSRRDTSRSASDQQQQQQQATTGARLWVSAGAVRVVTWRCAAVLGLSGEGYTTAGPAAVHGVDRSARGTETASSGRPVAAPVLCAVLWRHGQWAVAPRCIPRSTPPSPRVGWANDVPHRTACCATLGNEGVGPAHSQRRTSLCCAVLCCA